MISFIEDTAPVLATEHEPCISSTSGSGFVPVHSHSKSNHVGDQEKVQSRWLQESRCDASWNVGEVGGPQSDWHASFH